MTSLEQMRQSNGCEGFRNDKYSKEKNKYPEKRSNPQQITSNCLGLNIQNPGLGEVKLKRSFKTGSNNIKKLRQRRKNKTENKSSRPAWSHKREPITWKGRLGTQC